MTEFKAGDRVVINTETPYHACGSIQFDRGDEGVVSVCGGGLGSVDEDGDIWVEFTNGRSAWVSPECLSLASNPVNPSHYVDGMPEGIQVIDIIKSQGADYLHGNLLKYALRWKFKNGVEDLKKAQVYLGWLIAQEEAR